MDVDFSEGGRSKEIVRGLISLIHVQDADCLRPYAKPVIDFDSHVRKITSSGAGTKSNELYEPKS